LSFEIQRTIAHRCLNAGLPLVAQTPSKESVTEFNSEYNLYLMMKLEHNTQLSTTKEGLESDFGIYILENLTQQEVLQNNHMMMM
jgi:hypothetical protein